MFCAFITFFNRSIADAANLEIDDKKDNAPAGWKYIRPTNPMLLILLKIPKVGAEDYAEDAELIIFKGLGGSATANIDRWKKTFGADDQAKAKVTDLEIAGGKGQLLDIAGSYQFKARPFDPNAKTEEKKGYAMVALHWEGPQNVYHFRLTGPAKTVEKNRQAFMDWLKSFK
jgi:hypothetical protein